MSTHVIHIDKLKCLLSTYTEDVLTLDELFRVVGKIQFARYPETPQTDELHLANINRKYGDLNN